MVPARHSKVFTHHSTNWFKPTSVEGLEIGKKSVLKIIGQAYDQKGIAVLVENAKSKSHFLLKSLRVTLISTTLLSSQKKTLEYPYQVSAVVLNPQGPPRKYGKLK